VSKVAEATLFERILVPLDGSSNAESILYQAQQLLCGRKGEVVLFHVLDAAPSAVSRALANPEAAEKYLKGVESRLTPFGTRVRRNFLAPDRPFVLEARILRMTTPSTCVYLRRGMGFECPLGGPQAEWTPI
jgi:nucleotide-binding universal stress UspA family protein